MSDASPPSQSPAPVLPRPVSQALGQALGWFRRLPRPARIFLVAATTLAVLVSGFVAIEKANEPYSPLFSQLDREDASSILAKLKELKVPYRVDADGSTIEVPDEKVRELRLELAGAGLPRGGGVGFESFDKMRLGATDFEQRVLYRRALEGELTRTIETIGDVQSARVHLVMPEKSVFVTRSEPASASIVLRLRPGRLLGASQVASIVHLVASAVPSLEADRITVVTTAGTMLHKPSRSGRDGSGDDGEDDDAQAAARSYEVSLEDRVRTMLEKIVGPGHADVRVAAVVDPGRVERLEEHYDPTKSALRSEEESTERGSGQLDDTVAGVPGAESNLPGGAAKGTASAKPAPSATPAPSASAAPTSPAVSAAASIAPSSATAAPVASNSGAIRESHTRNYEIDHVTEKRVVAAGALRRIAVAVVLDGVKGEHGMVGRPREELDRLAALVRSAVGASDARGDVVTVESMPFVSDPDVAADASQAPVRLSPWATRLALARKWGPVAAGAVILLVLVVAVSRRRHAPVASQDGVAQMAAQPPAAQLAQALTPVLESADVREKAHARATQDPATAALVLRFWLGTSTGDARDAAKT